MQADAFLAEQYGPPAGELEPDRGGDENGREHDYQDNRDERFDKLPERAPRHLFQNPGELLLRGYRRP